MSKKKLTLDFSEIGIRDIARVGGKNASLGELFNSLKPQGINVLDGFAVTAEAFRLFIAENKLTDVLRSLFKDLNADDTKNLQNCGRQARGAILKKEFPEQLRQAILAAYEKMCVRLGREPELAVRSSATAEDLPEASFAGAAETFLNVRGKNELLEAVRKCFASLYTDRAISYRAELGYDQLDVALSVGVQPMVRSDLAASGVIFTLDTESGFRDAVIVTGSYGLGELVVQGIVSPDEWTVFKPTLNQGHRAIVSRRIGTKESKLVYAAQATKSVRVGKKERFKFSLSDEEVLRLAHWACRIETHYSELAGKPTPMDIEWAKDGATGEIFIVQARPETVHSRNAGKNYTEVFRLKKQPPKPILKGQAVGEKIGAGRARVVSDVSELAIVKAGDVLVARHTTPDWEPVMKKVSAIVTDNGGRTAHAAIISRELGIPCIVGTKRATEILTNGENITVCCAEGAEGSIYAGKLDFEIKKTELSNYPQTRTKIMFNVANPDRAFSLAQIPNDGVGLARIEFIVNRIDVHPMAIVNLDKLKNRKEKLIIKQKIAEAGEQDAKEFFVRSLAEGVGKIAAAFYPKPVVVRTSDFKTNEYACLLGGAQFEPDEENPMLGFRGASRYTDKNYREGFALECAALKKVREEMGLFNLKIMIPFCRTIKEARRVIEEMAKHGLVQGENDLEIYAMCELPANVIRAKDFLEIFDGFSIGSNDLTQLVLGIDRDSGMIASAFDEEDSAVKDMIGAAIRAAREMGKPIGICGQAPSDKPDFAAWLVREGVTSISLNSDSAMKTRLVIAGAEKALNARKKIRRTVTDRIKSFNPNEVQFIL